MKQHPRLKLAHLPTPIIKLERLSKALGIRLWMWREDLTGFLESGNKIRKLEYILAEAKSAEASRIITCGGPQSNHARTTVMAARRLGMDVTVVIREPREGYDHNAPVMGNLFLNGLAGARLRWVPFDQYVQAGRVYDPFLEDEAETSRTEGAQPFVIPEGGSCPTGTLGYYHAVAEMLATWQSAANGSKAPDSLFLALGSGGTHAGLHLGYQAHGLPPESICAVNVCDSAFYFQKRVGALIEATAERYGLDPGSTKLSIFDGHVGAGYGQASDEDLRYYAELLRRDGVLLDPIYTGKAFRGMLRELRRNPGRFGRDVLFLHSGGLFANFAFSERYTSLGLA